jgi:endonuclease YncB( thermonuclease family)
VDGDTLVIEMTGTTPATPEAAKGTKIELRLVGIQAPKLPLGRPDFQPWPLGEESKSALAHLAQAHTLTLAFGGQKLDRHGRLLAHLYAEDGIWIQGEMLRQGQARVYTFADNRKLVAEMYALERAAREAKRGIWADPFYAVRKPQDLEALEGTFQIVEGTVTKAATVRSRGYLNFGEDWKTDFTVEIPSAGLALFRRAKLDIAAYGGKRVRVRGWVGSYRGATIEATHPEQIEVLDP